MIEQSTVVTAVMVSGGLIAQAAYLKGVFSTRIENNAQAIRENEKKTNAACKRLDDGTATFHEIRESMAAMTGTLKAATDELNRLRDAVVYRDACGIMSGSLDKRIERVEHKENGNE